VYPQVFGKYVLERELSRGGMARVVLATLRGAGGFEKRLVVKQIRDELSFDQQFVRRFVEEAKTTVALSHPNIVPVYELGVEQGTYFLAMELVEGVSIAELVRERNPDGTKRVLSPEEGAYVGMEVCRALDYAHRRMKVVHRDITPRNVMLDEEGQVKLIDFGIAAPARVAGHEILGSPGHMPPEQVDGGELGPPTDIFAVAVLLMEAWTGVAPFRRPTPEECEEAMRRPHPRPSDFNPKLAPLDEAIGRAMKLDPRERQQAAAELGRSLRSFLRGVDPSDLARALGDRVRELREAQSSPSPPDGTNSIRPPNPSHGDLGTKTFAARDDALWPTPKLGDTASVPPDAPSTRRLDDAPEALRAAREAARPTPTRPKIDPAMSIPTPLMIEPEEPKAQEPAQKVEREEKLETIATRPLETPVHRRDSLPAAPPRSRAWLYGVALVLVAGGGVVAWRAKTNASGVETPPLPAPTTATATATTSAPTASSTVAPAISAAPSETVAAPKGTATNAVLAPSALVQAPATTTASSTEKAGRAVVTLLGDPGTRVLVDGAPRGTCPRTVSLDPGSHDVRFVFDPTGESRGQPILVKAGEKITVRADFTRATPTVTILR
jgi:serine/threonine-protein kinase